MAFIPSIVRAEQKPAIGDAEDVLDSALDELEAAGIDAGQFLNGAEPSAQLFAGASLSEPTT